MLLMALGLAAPASAATRQFTVGSFERVRVTGPYSVTIALGTPKAVATGDARALEAITVEVQAGTLIVRPARPTTGGSGDWGNVAVALATPALRGVALLGSGNLAIAEAKGQAFDLVVTGPGDARIERLTATSASIAAAGSGRVAAAGRAERLRLEVQGSGQADLSGLASDDVDVVVNGSGQTRLTAAKTAKVVALGAAEVVVIGRPRCTVRTGGAAQVRCGSDQQQRR